MVEEKRQVIEYQLKEELYNWRADVRPNVLGKFDEARLNVVRATVEAASEAVLCLIAHGLNESMNRYNGWCAEAAQSEDRK